MAPYFKYAAYILSDEEISQLIQHIGYDPPDPSMTKMQRSWHYISTLTDWFIERQVQSYVRVDCVPLVSGEGSQFILYTRFGEIWSEREMDRQEQGDWEDERIGDKWLRPLLDRIGLGHVQREILIVPGY
jgi:hypothetical protein